MQAPFPPASMVNPSMMNGLEREPEPGQPRSAAFWTRSASSSMMIGDEVGREDGPSDPLAVPRKGRVDNNTIAVKSKLAA